MSAERWLPVPGFERYEVSDHGRVVSSCRGFRRPLKGFPITGGYPAAKLYGLDGLAYKLGFHQIVLLAFVGPRPNGLVTRHLDGNPQNNHLSNLRYGTNTENAEDALRHGRNPYAVQTECIHGHEFTPENTYYSTRPTGRRRRHCRECNRQSCLRAYYVRRQLVAAS